MSGVCTTSPEKKQGCIVLGVYVHSNRAGSKKIEEIGQLL